MKRCKECLKASGCRKKNLPYAIAIPFSLFAAMLTWITMNVIGASSNMIYGISLVACLIAGGAIMAYTEMSVERHCIDDSRRQHRLS